MLYSFGYSYASFTRSLIIAACTAILLATPIAHAQTTSADCTAGQRKATQAEADAFAQLGQRVEVGSCFPTSMLDTAATLPAVVQELGTYACPGFQVGYSANMSPATLKESRIYFSATVGGKQISQDPKFLTCARDFLRAAKSAGLQPCIRAALRTADHQRASCLDQSNTTVCGRSNDCTDFSSCRHVMGIAMDINTPTGNYSQLHTLASRMGLTFPYPTNDKVHMEATASCRGTGLQVSNPATSAGATTGGQTTQPGGTQTVPAGTVPQTATCTAGLVAVNGQCLPTQCNGTSPYAVTSVSPIQTIWCNGTGQSVLGVGQSTTPSLVSSLLTGGSLQTSPYQQPYTGGVTGALPSIVGPLMQLLTGGQTSYPSTLSGGTTIPTSALVPVYTSTGQTVYVPSSQTSSQGVPLYNYGTIGYGQSSNTFGTSFSGYNYMPQNANILQQLLISLRAAVTSILSAIGLKTPLQTTVNTPLQYDTSSDVDAL